MVLFMGRWRRAWSLCVLMRDRTPWSSSLTMTATSFASTATGTTRRACLVTPGSSSCITSWPTTPLRSARLSTRTQAATPPRSFFTGVGYPRSDHLGCLNVIDGCPDSPPTVRTVFPTTVLSWKSIIHLAGTFHSSMKINYCITIVYIVKCKCAIIHHCSSCAVYLCTQGVQSSTLVFLAPFFVCWPCRSTMKCAQP